MKKAISNQLSVISRRGIPLLAGLVAGLLTAERAYGLATSGVLLTNTVMFTFSTASNPAVPYILGTYLATGEVLVQNPLIVPIKTATPTLQAAGSEITFRVCVQNASATASAFNVMVNDRLPDNMEGAGVVTTYWNNSVPAGVWTETYSSVFPGPYAAGAPGAGQDAPYYMRWNLGWLGPMRSGCVEFRARIL